MNAKVLLNSLASEIRRLKNFGMYNNQREFQLRPQLHHPLMPFKLSDIGEGIREVTVKQCFIKPNQKLNQFEDVCEVESDKASVTITSRFDGEVKSIYFKEGDVISVGSTLCDIQVEATDNSVKPLPLTSPSVTTAMEKVQLVHVDSHPLELNKRLATPAVRRLSREYNVDLKLLSGSGKDGRILKEDILMHLNQPHAQQMVSPSNILSKNEEEIIQPLSGFMKVMYQTMTESNRIPSLGLSDEVDVTDIEAVRKSIQIQMEPDTKLTILAFIVKAMSLSLKQYPILNSVFENDAIRYKKAHNICIAVDSPGGLVVPNIKNASQLSVRDIAKEISRLQLLAAEGKLSLADTRDGTFTISNIGTMAGTVLRPLILPPQVAIVGIGRAQALPRYNSNDQLQKRLILTISWSADHRIIDGATVARCSNLFKKYLENPGYLIFDA